MIRAALLLAALAVPAAAQAGVLDRVRTTNTLRCGAVERPGFADAGEDGRVSGLAVDLCRALTVAVLGTGGTTAFHLYGSAQAFEPLGRDDADDVSFLTGEEVRAHGLAGRLVPGPTVFVAELTALTRPGVSGLAGRTVCFMNGSAAHQALEAWATRTGTTLVRSGYQEDGEMHDAFDARRCDAVAGEATELAEIRAEAPGRAGARILPPFGLVPVMAATPAVDGAWASLVGWGLAAIVQSERAPNPWRGDLPGTGVPGLRPGWQAEAMSAVGGYDEMVDRNLGDRSPLGLTSHGNAAWPGGLLLPPGPR